MATPLHHRPADLVLTEAEVEEFRALLRGYAGAELTSDDARSLAHQLLRILAIVRDVAAAGSSHSDSSVDKPLLPESRKRAITTSSPP